MSIDANSSVISDCIRELQTIKDMASTLTLSYPTVTSTGMSSIQLQNFLDKLTKDYKDSLEALVTAGHSFAIMSYYYLRYADSTSSV